MMKKTLTATLALGSLLALTAWASPNVGTNGSAASMQSAMLGGEKLPADTYGMYAYKGNKLPDNGKPTVTENPDTMVFTFESDPPGDPTTKTYTRGEDGCYTNGTQSYCFDKNNVWTYTDTAPNADPASSKGYVDA